ncbi:MAG: DNA mismatch repair protein MutS [Methylophaga sp.]|nr:MAG: DNA mismatch repair protein MutS [Methylophaga sp.]
MSKKNAPDEQSDSTLFQQEMGVIEKIAQDKVHHRNVKPKPMPKFRQQRIEHNLNSTFSDHYEPHTIGSEETLSFRRSGIQHRLFSRLRSGHIQIEAELDLHGMTVAIAHRELARFLQDCQTDTLRCVRIVHGKGWSSKDQKPVLKTKLNSWLQQDDDVLAFCSAPIEDGGTGAVYVLLRRTKR